MAHQAGVNDEPTYQVRALERGLQVLIALATDIPQASLQDLHRYTGLNKATLLRLLDVLQRTEFIEQDPGSGDYRLGMRAFEVGSAYLPNLPIEQIAQPYLRELVAATHQTANLGVLAGLEVVHVATIAPDRSLHFRIRVGFRDALHWTALGKVLAAGMDDDAFEALLATGPFARRTPATITDPEAFRAEIERVRANGLAADLEECTAGLNCLAAPIRDSYGCTIAAVSISGLAHEVTSETRPALEDALLRAANAISRRFGYVAPQPNGKPVATVSRR
ncbi:MAG TPA: IclR family transcriptional regulator [Thermomicrobiales bacterium]|jgi:IclR family acetate operon transcriptional repressor